MTAAAVLVPLVAATGAPAYATEVRAMPSRDACGQDVLKFGTMPPGGVKTVVGYIAESATGSLTSP